MVYVQSQSMTAQAQASNFYSTSLLIFNQIQHMQKLRRNISCAARRMRQTASVSTVAVLYGWIAVAPTDVLGSNYLCKRTAGCRPRCKYLLTPWYRHDSRKGGGKGRVCSASNGSWAESNGQCSFPRHFGRKQG